MRKRSMSIVVVLMVLLLALAACGGASGGDTPMDPDQPIPVEPDGGIGDTPVDPDQPIPVEPDGGIGDTPVDPNQPIPVEPDGGIGDTPVDPDQPVSSDDPIPVEPDGGIGDTPVEPGDGELLINPATVEQIDILIMESFPLQVRVVARGALGDGCTELHEIVQERDGNTFNVMITTARPADAVCTQILQSFEESIPLDVEGLPAGEYTVDVNGVRDTFTFTQDNALPSE